MKFKNYLQAIQEMKISINFSEMEKDQYNLPNDIIAIIKNALNKNGYNCFYNRILKNLSFLNNI